MPRPSCSPLPVCAGDLANLRASGLSDATIRANGLRTEGGALVFPYRGLDGAVNCFARRRPHSPPVIGGKAAKYVQPKGSPLRAYFPVGSLPKLRDGRSAVYITEGEKKALALAQLGLAAVGLGGVWCGCKKGAGELIDDLAAVPWKGRAVYVASDFDPKAETRRHVDSARRRLARALRKAGAKEVYSVELPPGPGGAKQGADDFLVAHGAGAFRALVERARPVPLLSEFHPLTRAEGRTDTNNVARLVARNRETARWVGAWDKWLLWDGTRWKLDQCLAVELRAKEVAAGLWREIVEASRRADGDAVKKTVPWATYTNSRGGIRNMVTLARSELAISPDELDADPWLLNVQNGTLDLRTGDLRAHRREDFITKLAPVTFDPDARCPLWQEFLDRIFAGNAELVAGRKGEAQRLLRALEGFAHQSGLLPEQVWDAADLPDKELYRGRPTGTGGETTSRDHFPCGNRPGVCGAPSLSNNASNSLTCVSIRWRRTADSASSSLRAIANCSRWVPVGLATIVWAAPAATPIRPAIDVGTFSLRAASTASPVSLRTVSRWALISLRTASRLSGGALGVRSSAVLMASSRAVMSPAVATAVVRSRCNLMTCF
jgi:hypothetical protein